MNNFYNSVFRRDLFKGKVILVTGGGSGIGRCTAFDLASCSAQVVISGRNQEKLDKTCEEFKAQGVHVYGQICDIRDEDQVEELVSDILLKYGRMDGLVNNAGGQFPSPLEKISKNGWEAVIRNNLTGTFLMSKEVCNQYFINNGGAIVNVLADFRNGMPFMGHSGAARAGVDNFTKTSAIEWAKYGIRVNSVAPGIVESSGLSHYEPRVIETARKNAVKIPLKRFSSESEIAAAIVFLLSPAASYITGATINIDGGLSLRGHTLPLEDYRPSEVFDGFKI